MSSEHPLVSVILPVFNGAEFVGCALESVMLQTYPNLEIVVVNDGSTDGTQAVLEAHAARDRRIRIIQQANAGVARARNRAIAESTGEFIAPIDADDLWIPQKIARQVKRIQDAGPETGLVYSWWVWIDAAGKVQDRSPRWAIQGEALRELVRINFIGSASVPLFRRDCLEEVGGYDETLAADDAGGCEDWDVALRIAAKYRVAVIQAVLLGYRRRPGSMSSACATMWRSQQRVMEGVSERCPELKPAIFRASAHQFAMYLAGVSYWSGNMKATFRWALRAGFRLPLWMLPDVAYMFLRLRIRKPSSLTMRPGIMMHIAFIPEPLLAYDRVLTWSRVVANLIGSLQSMTSWALRMRLQLEYRLSVRSANSKKQRVWMTSSGTFPWDSQPSVCHESLQLMKVGFDVRLAYSALAPHTQLPIGAEPVWGIGRRMLLYKFVADRDFVHYNRLMPQHVHKLAQRIADASEMLEEEVYNHHHFRQAFSFTRMVQAWHADYIHTSCSYEQALYGLTGSTMLDLPSGVSCHADHILRDDDLKVVGLYLRSCDVVVAASGRITEELEEIAGEPLAAAIIKPNGLDAIRCEQVFCDAVRQAIEQRDPFRRIETVEQRPDALRIALLSFEYPPETGYGGIGSYTWYQARALARLGHRVHVLAGSPEYLPMRMRAHDGVMVHRYHGCEIWMPLAVILRVFGCHWTRQRLENAWCMYQGLRHLMKHYEYDIIEIPECGAEGALITWLLRVPTVVRFHGPAGLIMSFYDPPKADTRMCTRIEQIAIDNASTLVSCSSFLANEVREKLEVTRHVRVIHNGIDLKLFDAEPVADLASVYGLREDEITILFAGRMERRKGIHLCAAIAEIVLRRHNVTFLFAGEDPRGYMREVLMPSLENMGLLGSARYLGKLNFQQLRSCTRAVDICLLPSLWENCPYACLEAMAAGRTIVASAQGGMPELIEHGLNGMLAETGSPESFAGLLSSLIEDRGLRQRLGAAARQSVEQHFTDVEMAAQTEKCYRAVLASQSGRN